MAKLVAVRDDVAALAAVEQIEHGISLLCDGHAIAVVDNVQAFHSNNSAQLVPKSCRNSIVSVAWHIAEIE